MNKSDKIYVAGHRGLVGAALVRHLREHGYENIVFATSREVNLREQAEVRRFMDEHRPDYVLLAAAKVGGILANDSRPAEFIYDNLMIEANVIHEAYCHDVKKLLFLGSTCIYPKFAPQPLREESLLTGPLEPTNEWYAVAKIAGIKMCQAYRRQYGCDFIAAMPTNLYGPNDNFDLRSSHVMPALIRKFHEAKVAGSPYVEIWGSGTPRREFLHVDDCASACIYLMESYDSEEIVNIGTGSDITIRELAELVRKVTGYQGELKFNTDMPDGTPRKLVDVSRITALGWKPSIGMESGLSGTYDWFKQNQPGV